MKAVLITGASSGIGEGFAREFAKRGHNLVLVARRMDRLESLRDQLFLTGVEVKLLAEDLAEAGAVDRIMRAVSMAGIDLEGVVNNAGLGFQKDLAAHSPEQIHRVVEVNMTALTRLMLAVLPVFLARKEGFILNVASTAAFQPVPHFSLYAATKSYVVSLSEAVHEEARRNGVTVTALCPGPVRTEFQGKAGMSPRFFARAQEVDEVVRAGFEALHRRRAVAWTSWFQRIFCFGSELTPRWIRRPLAGWVLRMSPGE